MISIILIICIALIFDFINGFHDAANSIATVVSTRVLSPRLAVLWAAFFNFIAFLFFGVHVATTIGKGVVNPTGITPTVIVAGLIGAIVWDLLTWYYGIPVSSSHALVGGLVGAAITHGGLNIIIANGIIKIAIFIVLSPILGVIIGFLLMNIVMILFQHSSPSKIDSHFRRFQLISAALYSLGHGGNDAQKTMGIIAVLLFTSGYLGKEFYVPLWVVLASHAAMGLGTLAGGWRIVKTMGQSITKLQPVGGFSAETSGAVILFGTTFLGIPVSTTHTITGSIIGVGAVKRLSAVRWGVAETVVWAWILTLPISGLIASMNYIILSNLI